MGGLIAGLFWAGILYGLTKATTFIYRRYVSATVSDESLRADTPISQEQVAPTAATTKRDSAAEDNAFEQALTEVESGETVKALWARALAGAEGDAAKSTALYIRFRVESLKSHASAIPNRAEVKANVDSPLRPTVQIHTDNELQSSSKAMPIRKSLMPHMVFAGLICVVLAAGFIISKVVDRPTRTSLPKWSPPTGDVPAFAPSKPIAPRASPAPAKQRWEDAPIVPAPKEDRQVTGRWQDDPLVELPTAVAPQNPMPRWAQAPEVALPGANKYQPAQRDAKGFALSPKAPISTPTSTATTRWLAAMSPKLADAIPEEKARLEFLTIIANESSHSGVDTQLVLALIEKLSQFRKYAVAVNGSKGYMQIHPTWVTKIGQSNHNLFLTRTNIRYGCVILRNYVDEHKGNYGLAITAFEQQVAGRFDEIIANPSTFSQDVIGLWRGKWRYSE